MCPTETFAGNPAVLGYDLLNEPWGDEVTEIGPLYEDIAARIRKHDANAILFIGPRVSTCWKNVGGNCGSGTPSAQVLCTC